MLQRFQYAMKPMHSDLRRLDLNLLLVFDALFRHQSVTDAADELSMSPSACSHALSRLRKGLNDELFIRAGQNMQPTLQARRIANGIAEALQLLSLQLDRDLPFQPETSSQTFVFAATDYTAFALLPPLAARLQHQAPYLRLQIVYSDRQDPIGDLEEGPAHFVLGVSHSRQRPRAAIEAVDCLSDEYVVACRQDHPRISADLDLQQYLAERHIAVQPWSDAGSVIDATLQRQDLCRDVAIQLPSLMAAPFVVSNTDHLLTLPRLAARQLACATPLALYRPPFATPTYMLQVLHHRRHLHSAGHAWMLQQVIQILQAPV